LVVRLFYHPLSSNSRRVIVTAFHLGTSLELERVDLLAGGQRTPEFRRMNPNGKVPVLEDDGFYLWESHAIAVYLADRSPARQLYPAEPRARADVNRWLFWSAYHFTPAVGTISREKVSKRMAGGAGGPDANEVARGERLFRDAAAVLDAQLGRQPWIADAGFSLADLAIAAPLMHTEAAELPVAEFANIARWFATIEKLPAWRAAALSTEMPAS
jgi:glutathione S-transferase